MDKLIVTSLRVNKNQRKFAPSLKKLKKNKNKKLENSSKSNTTDNNTKNIADKKNDIVKNNSVTQHSNIDKQGTSQSNKKDPVVIRKLDTLKESKIFGFTNSFTGSKKSTSNSRLKLLAELEEEGQSNLSKEVQSPRVINSSTTHTINNQIPIIPVKIATPSNLTTFISDDTKTNDAQSLNEGDSNNTTTTTSLSPSSPKNSSDRISNSIENDAETIQSLSSKPSLINNKININTDHTSTEDDNLNTQEPIKSTSISSSLSDDEITLAKTDDDNQSTIVANDNISVLTLDQDEIDNSIDKMKKILNNMPTHILKKNNDEKNKSFILEIPTRESSNSNIDKIKSESNDQPSSDSDNESSSITDSKINSSKILSKQNSSNRKRKSGLYDDGDNDDDNDNDEINDHSNNNNNNNNKFHHSKKRHVLVDNDISLNSSSSPKRNLPDLEDDTFNLLCSKLNKLKNTSNEISLNSSTSPKRNLSDLEDDTFNLLCSKLNKLNNTSDILEKKISKFIDSKEKDETDEAELNENEDSTIIESDAESDKSNGSANDDENTNDNTNENATDNANEDDDDNDESVVDNQEQLDLKNSKKIFKSPPRRKAKSYFNDNDEPIVFNKRTLADIIDNYHGKERSNIQKERYKLAAQKRKATLRRKRLSKMGITDPELENESVEIKPETPKIIERKPTENVAAVQMRVVNGVAVIDNSSICINHIDTTNELPITLKENQDTPITSLSFKKNSNRSKKWKKDETDLFYQCISICGTDFGMMSVIMPHRNRKQLINKYHRESRLNPERVRKAFEKRKILDNKNFSAILEKIKSRHLLNISNTNKE